MKLERRDWIEIISTIALLGGGFYAYGKFDERLAQMEKRLDKMEDRVEPLKQLRVGKGDLCLKLIEQYGSVKDTKRQETLLRQWDDTGCGGVAAAAMEITNAVEEKPDALTNSSDANR